MNVNMFPCKMTGTMMFIMASKYFKITFIYILHSKNAIKNIILENKSNNLNNVNSEFNNRKILGNAS